MGPWTTANVISPPRMNMLVSGYAPPRARGSAVDGRQRDRAEAERRARGDPAPDVRADLELDAADLVGRQRLGRGRHLALLAGDLRGRADFDLAARVAASAHVQVAAPD